MLALMFLIFIIPVILLIHLIATVCFYKKGYYRSRSFTIKQLLIALIFPIAGMALITFEYLMNLSKNGIHVGTFLSVFFVYSFISLLFAIPYLIYLMTKQKDDSTLS